MCAPNAQDKEEDKVRGQGRSLKRQEKCGSLRENHLGREN